MCVCSLYPLVEHPQRKLTSVGFTQSMYYTTTRQGGYYTKFDTGVCRTDNMGGQSPDWLQVTFSVFVMSSRKSAIQISKYCFLISFWTLKVRILRSLTRLFIILVSLIRSLLSEKILISNRCISGLMSNLIKKSWTDSNLYSLNGKGSIWPLLQAW